MHKNCVCQAVPGGEGSASTTMVQAYRLFIGAACRDGFTFKQASQLWKQSTIRQTLVEEVSEAERKKRKY